MKYKLKCVATTKGWFSNGGQLSAPGGWGREEIQLLQSFTDYQGTILLMEQWAEPFLSASFADNSLPWRFLQVLRENTSASFSELQVCWLVIFTLKEESYV